VIGRLKGRIVASEPDGTLLVDVGGVGYEVEAPLGTQGRLATEPDHTVVVHVHTHVREDALQLFGFATADERAAFRTLLGISKVGPRLALSVLGSVSVHELSQLVETGQSGRLTKIPGVGKKTAERMVLELRGKLGPIAGPPSPMTSTTTSQGPVLQEALVRMGFKQAEAERAVASLPDLGRPMGELLREALAVLSP
jgi:Holliday junction DNA helicase RuvA